MTTTVPRRSPWAPLALVVFACWASPTVLAHAQQAPQPLFGPSVQVPRPLVPPTATDASRSAARPPGLLRIDARVCRRLLEHVPDPDVTYRPGVDVRGRPVAPADATNWSQFEALVPDAVTFHIAVDALDYIDGQRPSPPEQAGEPRRWLGVDSAEAILGTITYDLVRNRFLINGRPLITSQQDALAWACRQGLSGRVRADRVITPPGYDGPPLPAPKPMP